MPTPSQGDKKTVNEPLKTHLERDDNWGRAAAAEFLLDVDGVDVALGKAATPRPEHEATGAESACIGGRGIRRT